MGTKMAVAFANIFMGKVDHKVQTLCLNLSAEKPLAWKRYIDDLLKTGSLDNAIREFSLA